MEFMAQPSTRKPKQCARNAARQEGTSCLETDHKDYGKDDEANYGASIHHAYALET